MTNYHFSKSVDQVLFVSLILLFFSFAVIVKFSQRTMQLPSQRF